MSTLLRIKQYIDYKGITNKKFEESVGFSNGAFASQLKNNRTIGVDKLENILFIYPEINIEWLLTGNGPMLREIPSKETKTLTNSRKTIDKSYEIQRVPLFNLRATMGLMPMINGDTINNEAIIDYISIPDMAQCDGATYVTGDSMYPLLKSGDIIAFKKVAVENIYFGEMYILSIYLDESSTYKTVKFIHRSELGNDYIKLVSQNKHHEDKDVRVNQIAALGLVRASIRLHN